MKKHIYFFVIVVLVLVAAGLVSSTRSMPAKNLDLDSNPDDAVACTMDAKMCPDGSYVGRSGPKCEFAACPGPSQSDSETGGENVAKLGQKISVGGIYITPIEVISDSRCPANVNCIWAGEIQVKVRLEKGSLSKDTVMKIIGADGNERVMFGGNAVSLFEVSPKESYEFTFKVDSVVSM